MSENWKIQVSPKLSDGTLINIRAESSEEAERLFAWAEANAPTIIGTARAFGAVDTLARAGITGTVVPTAPAAQPAPQQAAPVNQASAPVCRHGQKKWVAAGVSKSSGKPYDGFWACTGQRGDQCRKGE